MKTGSFVKWSGTDGGDRFCYGGQLIKLTDERVTILTVDGEMTFPLDDGEVVKIRKPTKFDDYINARKEVAAKLPKAKKASPKRKRKSKKGSKIERARVLLLTGGKMPSRKDGIALLVKELDMTPAGASTYYANVKRAS